jgi:hypothetical protein
MKFQCQQSDSVDIDEEPTSKLASGCLGLVRGPCVIEQSTADEHFSLDRTFPHLDPEETFNCDTLGHHKRRHGNTPHTTGRETQGQRKKYGYSDLDLKTVST